MADGGEHVVWQACSVNCGSHCALRLHVRDGVLQWVESDGAGVDDAAAPQMRACLRGRATRWWLDAPERLNWPLRRVGARGEGRFERISWDEALDEVAAGIQRIVAIWGNEAVLIPYGTGLHPVEGSPFERLMNCYGGYLGVYGDYSCAQLQAGLSFTYGDKGYLTSSTFGEAANADLVVVFGSNPCDTRMGGASASFELARARERGDFRLISIDPRHTDVVSRGRDEWIPIRPGTDAALVAGLAHVLISEDLVDEAFLARYCVGYDSSTLPPSAPANASYKDYVMGAGPDGVAKTPRWAARITGVPATRITSLAREMAAARALYVAQGWGPQRSDAGEATARAICMLSLLTGNFGLPGTNSGARERFLSFTMPESPVGPNPAGVRIPAFTWSAAVERGCALTARNAGVRGADHLPAPVKLIINHAGNCLTNQHADANRTARILADEGACELIVCVDVMLTDSARYADIILPDLARVEQDNLVSSGSADMLRGAIRGNAWEHETHERRSAWDMAADLARRLGVYEAFSAGCASQGDVDRMRFSDAAAAGSPPCDRMSFEELEESGAVRVPYTGPTVAYAAFRADPEANPLPTPSGKVEIYSAELARLADILEYADDQAISPLPVYQPQREGYESPLAGRFPFQLVSCHGRGSTHSTFANVAVLQEVSPRELSVNTVDAERLGLRSGQPVVAFNDRGALVARVRVTPRIMPGVVALPQGAWRDVSSVTGLDWGGCVNTLTSDRPTALARGNAHNSCRVALRPLTQEERAEGRDHGW